MISIFRLQWFPLLAHPGHGSIPAENPAHYVFEPAHALWSVLALGAILLLYMLMKSHAGRQIPARVKKPDGQQKAR